MLHLLWGGAHRKGLLGPTISGTWSVPGDLKSRPPSEE